MAVPWTGVAAAPVVRVKVLPVRVAPSIGSLNVALTFPLMGTLVAPARGVWERTVGVPVVVPSRAVEPPLLELPQATNENSSRKAEAGFQRGNFRSLIIRFLSCGAGRR